MSLESERPFTVEIVDERGRSVGFRASNPIDHPLHYTSSPAKCEGCGKPIECITIVEHLGFNVGNAIKYLWREDFKGTALDDLKKAAWYIAREIAKREKAAP